MWVFPVLLDSRPRFTPSSRTASLLLAPLGTGTVLSHLRSRLAALSEAPPVVVPSFDFDADYERNVRAACPDAEGVDSVAAFVESCLSHSAADRLLLIDPTCFPADPLDPAILALSRDEDARWARHLVVLERGDEGTKERVDTDDHGRVRSIQRYYDSVNWPFVAGVACSLVPVACLRLARGLPLVSLPEFRRALVADGVPSRDFSLERGALNLSSERGLLSLNERVVLDLARRDGFGDGSQARLIAVPGSHVHPSACVVGPVVLQGGAEVEEAALIIGPTVVGPGGRVGAGATVAHCIIGREHAVPAGKTFRQRALLAGGAGEEASVVPEATGVSSPDGWEAPPIDLSAERPRRRLYPAVKRVVEAAVAALGLVLLSPLGLLIAAVIKLESRGPVFFSHFREGMEGRRFLCWKFRTMVPGADIQQRQLSRLNKMDGPQFKVDTDPRLTRIGRFLTATNLDELPQLANVLLGQMSLVGPRPSPFRENQVCIPWREGRLSVRPGITGLWQVCRHDRDKGDFHQWIYYDLLYVQHLSLWLDIKVLIATLVAPARGGTIPLSWLLPPEKYGERRALRRSHETTHTDPGN